MVEQGKEPRMWPQVKSSINLISGRGLWSINCIPQIISILRQEGRQDFCNSLSVTHWQWAAPEMGAYPPRHGGSHHLRVILWRRNSYDSLAVVIVLCVNLVKPWSLVI